MTRLVVGNWKMNPATVVEAVALARAVAHAVGGTVDVGVAPPFVALPAVAETLRRTKVQVYAQDVHWEERGAYTGQTSVTMLGGIATGVIIGHSETRRDLGDDDARVARKLARAVAAGLRPILCVGETEAQHEAGEADEVVARQIRQDVARLEAGTIARIVVAYEPIWAIGTGRPAGAQHAARAARVIRDTLAALGADADSVRVLYGGSVTAAGVAEFAAAEGIAGALVGGASLDAKEFAAIVRAFG